MTGNGYEFARECREMGRERVERTATQIRATKSEPDPGWLFGGALTSTHLKAAFGGAVAISCSQKTNVCCVVLCCAREGRTSHGRMDEWIRGRPEWRPRTAQITTQGYVRARVCDPPPGHRRATASEVENRIASNLKIFYMFLGLGS